jgi:hypothetical protein
MILRIKINFLQKNVSSINLDKYTMYAITENVLSVIAEYVVIPTVKLLDWVDESKLCWEKLSINYNAIDLLEKHPDKIIWFWLSQNPAAIHLLENHPDRIDWYMLSKNPAAIHLLEANPNRINWWQLSKNPAAIHLLDRNQAKIYWEGISKNPAIFKVDRVAHSALMLQFVVGIAAI